MSDYGIVTEAGAVRFERLLPGPVERVWEYLTDSELRRTWFAAGDMELRPGGGLTLLFRNSELAPDDEEVPEKYRQYEGMESKGQVVRVEPPRLLVFEWFEEEGLPTEVSFELEPRGEQTLLILTHRGLPNRAMTVDVSGGWHLHLDVLGDVLAGRPRRPFWARNAALEREYQGRIPADEPEGAAGPA
jgi:uncharacterized protein YndB with AHSA1/START domain